MTPVVFIHYGAVPEYLRMAIRQAKKFNQDVVLVTDQEVEMDGVTVVAMEDLQQEVQPFIKVYHHLSKNPIDFELKCFLRWGIMKKLMEVNRYDRVFYCDSDVLLYVNVNSMPETGAAYSTPIEQPEFRWSASAHVSMFTYDVLCDLWRFIMKTYENKTETFFELKSKYKHHLTSGAPGGVCDMTLLYLFSRKHEVTPLCSVIDNTTFDHNINSSENSLKDEYEMREVASPYGTLSIKSVRMVNGIPFCLNLDREEDIKFHSLHFQGAAKSIMSHFI